MAILMTDTMPHSGKEVEEIVEDFCNYCLGCSFDDASRELRHRYGWQRSDILERKLDSLVKEAIGWWVEGTPEDASYYDEHKEDSYVVS